jgi:hypothetical protein
MTPRFSSLWDAYGQAKRTMIILLSCAMKEEKIILGLLLGATFERGKDTKMSKGG